MRQIILDTETTGLSAENGDRIIEIGCVELVGRKLTGHHFHHYVNPEREIDEGAFRVHGISNDFVRDKPKFAAIAAQFLDYVRGAELIIHNAAFDVGFLNKELSLVGLPPLSEVVSGVIDTLTMAKELFPGKRNSLDALCDRLGVDNSGRQLHGALLDAELLADVYIYMTRGQEALLVDDTDHTESGPVLSHLDLRRFELLVIRAKEHELAEHEAVLAQLDKATGGKTVWRTFEPLPSA